MVRRVVRFILAGQREGLAQQRQTHQREDANGLGHFAAAKRGHTNTMVARAYVLRLTEYRALRRG
jgi:hypothetical protein